jgi:hypothetical protein
MKRLILALGIGAAAMAISTPASAQTGCRWYDVNCRLSRGEGNGTIGTAGRVDTSWHVVGHDANGNAIYERRRVDGNGNVITERARRDALGRMVIIDRDIDNRNNRVLNSTRYGVNGERCKYQENQRGYKINCKYDRNGNLITTTGRPSERFGTAGADCKFQSNPSGYKEQCKYTKNKSNGVYRSGVYRTDNGVYRTNKVKGNKYKTANVNGIYGTTVNGGKYKVAKLNSAKYNKGNGKAKGHNKH